MKALICHCKEYSSEITGLSDRPADIVPEAVNQRSFHANEAVVALITVERGDDVDRFAPRLAEEIRRMCDDIGRDTVVLLPFAHLSARLADSSTSVLMIDRVATELSDLSPVRLHFGSDKRLLLDIPGHAGNVRFREFSDSSDC